MKSEFELRQNKFSIATPGQGGRKTTITLLVMLGLLMLSGLTAQAQETSRQIPFTNLQTVLSPGSTQLLTVQLQDAQGTVLLAEEHPEVTVDAKGRISLLFGAATKEGLDPAQFPSGSSRFIDVLLGSTSSDTASVLTGGRIALTAAAFALSPGPEGPTGPEGPRGPVGPAGPAATVNAADASIQIGGKLSFTTIAVAPNGINNSKVADGALSPLKIAGTAATLGTNIFNGNQIINGTLNVAGAINSGTQYSIGGKSVLSNAGNSNLFAGVGAGQSNTVGSNNSYFGSAAGFGTTTGNSNSFFGAATGSTNTTGSRNSFFGNTAGVSNTIGKENAFFGSSAGISNVIGDGNAFFGFEAGFSSTSFFNSFFGARAGKSNTTGFNNSFFGEDAGLNNTTGRNNAFFGLAAGGQNTTGEQNAAFGGVAAERNSTGGQNSFFGFFAGRFNSTGSDNAFFGRDAGRSNSTESFNTFIGAASNGAAGITNATAIGANAVVTQSNSVALGNNANVGIGTSAPQARLHVQGGNINVGSAGQGLILKSPNGAVCRLLTISNGGSLAITPIACQ